MTNMQSGVNLRAFTNTVSRIPMHYEGIYIAAVCNLLYKIINTAYNEGTISVNDIAVMVEAVVQDTSPEQWLGSVRI
jgi:hypothetical protein